MSRMSLACVIALAAVAGSGQVKRPVPLQTQLQTSYNTLNAGFKQNSYSSVAGWFKIHTTADFVYTSKQKQKFNRDLFLKGVADQIKVVKTIDKQTMSISKAKVTGNKAVLESTGYFAGTVLFDSKQLLMIDSSASTDTWVLEKGVWKLASMTVTKEDVQMYDHK